MLCSSFWGITVVRDNTQVFSHHLGHIISIVPIISEVSTAGPCCNIQTASKGANCLQEQSCCTVTKLWAMTADTQNSSTKIPNTKDLLQNTFQWKSFYFPIRCVWRVNTRGGGDPTAEEKHWLEKIHFNLPNAGSGLVTFTDWYFPSNSIVSLSHSVKDLLTSSDYRERVCSRSNSWGYSLYANTHTQTIQKAI